MFAHLNSIGLYGMDAFEVNVEADISNGLPGFDVVGLPDTAVKESRDRVRSALKNCGFTFPMSRITVNLAPADKRKEGPIYDLPILLAILTASGQLSCDLSDQEMETLRLWCEGKTNAEIAAKLHVAESSVRTYINRMLEKTGYTNRNRLMVAAVSKRLVVPSSQLDV